MKPSCTNRRSMLSGLMALSAWLAFPKHLFAARPDKAFDATSGDDAIAELFGFVPTPSERVWLKVADIAENGAVVPVTVRTDLENVQAISVVVDRNPTPLAASFQLGPRSRPEVSVRIKMGESSRVRAIVLADGKLFSASKDVKVTIGGCGG